MRTNPPDTASVIHQFNHAFVEHTAALLDDLIAEDCVMESVEPAPDGTRYEGYDACLAFWKNLADSRDSQFTPEDVAVFADRAVIRWRFRFGPGLSQSVRGVNLMRVRDGLIVEALGYVKSGNASSQTPGFR